MKKLFILAALLIATSCRAQTITYQSGGSGINTNTAGLTVQVTGLTWTSGWLLVLNCTAPTGDTLTASDNNSGTWTNNPSTHTSGVFSALQSYSIVGTSGSSKSVTCTSNTSGYLIVNVVAYSATNGWPVSALDQRGSTEQTSGTTITVTAGGANTQAVEVNVVIVGDNNANQWSNPTATYTQRQNDPNGFERIWDKITSSTETASFSVSFTVAPTQQTALLGTYKPNTTGPVGMNKREKYEQMDP